MNRLLPLLTVLLLAMVVAKDSRRIVPSRSAEREDSYSRPFKNSRELHSKGYSKGSKGYSKGSKGYTKGYTKGSKGYSKGSKGGKRCVDYSDFRFKTENSGMKGCAWLRRVRERQDKYCEMKGWDGNSRWKVKFQCRRSCAKYLDGDQFDSCDKYLDNCKDSDSFKFEVDELFGIKKGCGYLRGNTGVKEKRRDEYCRGNVKKACEKSCDNC